MSETFQLGLRLAAYGLATVFAALIAVAAMVRLLLWLAPGDGKKPREEGGKS